MADFSNFIKIDLLIAYDENTNASMIYDVIVNTVNHLSSSSLLFKKSEITMKLVEEKTNRDEEKDEVIAGITASIGGVLVLLVGFIYLFKMTNKKKMAKNKPVEINIGEVNLGVMPE